MNTLWNKFFKNKSIIRMTGWFAVTLGLVVLVILFVIFARFFTCYRSTVKSYAQTFLSISADTTEKELEQLEQTIQVFLSDNDLQNNVKIICDDNTDQFTFHKASIKVESSFYEIFARIDYLEGYAIFNNDGECKKQANLRNIDEIINFRRNNVYGKMGYCYNISPNLKDTIYFHCNITEILPYEYRVIGQVTFVINAHELFEVYQKADVFGGEFVIRTKDGGGGRVGGENIEEELYEAYIADSDGNEKTISYNRQSFYVISEGEKSKRFSYQLFVPMEEIDEANIRFLVVTGVVVAVMLLLLSVYIVLYLRNIVVPLKNIKRYLDIGESDDIDFVQEELNEFTKNEIVVLHKRLRQAMQELQLSIEEKYKYQSMLKETHLKQLQLQMNPHFLYNTLNILYLDSMEKGQEETAEIISNMGKLFRFATDIKCDVVSIAEERKLLEAYSAIQLMRNKQRLKIDIRIDEIYYRVRIPKFSIQPLLENAIHALVKSQMSSCRIIIEVHQEGDDIEVWVLDNGEGVSEQTMELIKQGEFKSKGTGIALYNIHHRIRYLFGSRYSVFTRKWEGMSVIGFRVPIDWQDWRKINEYKEK